MVAVVLGFTKNVSLPGPPLTVKLVSPAATRPVASIAKISFGAPPSFVPISTVTLTTSKKVTASKATPSLVPVIRFRPAAGLSTVEDIGTVGRGEREVREPVDLHGLQLAEIDGCATVDRDIAGAGVCRTGSIRPGLAAIPAYSQDVIIQTTDDIEVGGDRRVDDDGIRTLGSRTRRRR